MLLVCSLKEMSCFKQKKKNTYPDSSSVWGDSQDVCTLNDLRFIPFNSDRFTVKSEIGDVVSKSTDRVGVFFSSLEYFICLWNDPLLIIINWKRFWDYEAKDSCFVCLKFPSEMLQTGRSLLLAVELWVWVWHWREGKIHHSLCVAAAPLSSRSKSTHIHLWVWTCINLLCHSTPAHNDGNSQKLQLSPERLT